ncbi:hypothetical protein [Sphaerimonospora mesophila]|uniref:hypothetical protein n=1 Tax=Sphaerimonospora mesophila TaxID=37483 RepID=UPI0006E1AA99
MPICTAIIAAALLSGPVGTPADQHSAADASPGKKIASFAMQNADQPDLIASKAMEQLLRDKNEKIGPLVAAGTQEPAAQAAQGPTGQTGPNGQVAPQTAPVAQAAQAGPEVQTGQIGQGADGQGPQGPIVQNAGQEPQDIFLHPQANSPMVRKLSGQDLVQQMPGQQMRETGSGQWSSDDED